MKNIIFIFLLFCIATSCEKVEMPILQEEPTLEPTPLIGDWNYVREVLDNDEFPEIDIDTIGTISFLSNETGKWKSSTGINTIDIEWDLQLDDEKISIAKYYNNPNIHEHEFLVYDIVREDDNNYKLIYEFRLTDVILVGIDPLRYRETITLKRF